MEVTRTYPIQVDVHNIHHQQTALTSIDISKRIKAKISINDSPDKDYIDATQLFDIMQRCFGNRSKHIEVIIEADETEEFLGKCTDLIGFIYENRPRDHSFLHSTKYL